MSKILLSFIPYALAFIIVYAISGVLLLKNRCLKEYDDLWKQEKAKILDPAFRVAFTLCVVIAAYQCIYVGHLSFADRLFVFFWAVWSVFAHRDLHEKK